MKNSRQRGALLIRWEDFQNRVPLHVTQHGSVKEANAVGAAFKKSRHLARGISEASWSEFVRQLRYKSEWYGRELVEIDRWYPSTKRCSCCGHVLSHLPLTSRVWDCPECGESHDRDINSAKNILAAGQAVSARGGSVRPKHPKDADAVAVEARIPPL